MVRKQPTQVLDLADVALEAGTWGSQPLGGQRYFEVVLLKLIINPNNSSSQPEAATGNLATWDFGRGSRGTLRERTQKLILPSVDVG